MHTIVTGLMVMTLVTAAPSASIMVRPSCEIAGAYVALPDVSNIQANDPVLAAELTDVRICPSPLPARTRRLTREQILIALRRAGIADGSIELMCPAEIVVTRAAATVSGQSLFETARDFALSGNSFPGPTTIEPVRVPADQLVPAGPLELRVKAGAKRISKGRSSLPVEIVTDGQVYRTIHVPILVKVVAPVLVSTTAIPKSAALDASNCSLQERDITFLPDDVVFSKPSEGCIAGAPIPESAIIRRSWVSQPPAIHSGDAIIVVVQNGAVRVTDKGIAVQDGRPGDRIKVRLSGQTREIRGTVAEPGIVRISIPRRNKK